MVVFFCRLVRTNAIVFERDPNGASDRKVLLPKPAASTDFYKGRIDINNRGYRGGDLAMSKGNAFRILTVGDSATFGQTLFPDSKPWSSVLQQLISSNLKCARPIEVVNGGVNGFHVRHAIAKIERDFPWLQPDMILSYFGWNATADIGIEPPTEESGPPAGRSAQVWWHIQKAAAAVVSGTATSIGRIIREDGDDVSGLLMQARRGKLYDELRQMVAQSKRLGYQLVFLSFNTAHTFGGAVAKVVGNWSGAVSGNMRVSSQAARSMG